MASNTAKTLTERDLALLETVTLRVPLVTDTQAGRTWWGQTRTPARSAWRRVGELERAGYLERYQLMSHPERSFCDPLVTWVPGQTAPNFGNLSYQLSKRWREEPVMIRAIAATPLAAGLMGGHAPGPVRPTEATHHVQLAGLFFHFLQSRPEMAARWRGEGGLKETRGRRQNGETPDALISPAAGCHESRLAIELGGRYAPERLMRLHQHCKSRGWRYELW